MPIDLSSFIPPLLWSSDVQTACLLPLEVSRTFLQEGSDSFLAVSRSGQRRDCLRFKCHLCFQAFVPALMQEPLGPAKGQAWPHCQLARQRFCLCLHAAIGCYGRNDPPVIRLLR